MSVAEALVLLTRVTSYRRAFTAGVYDVSRTSAGVRFLVAE